MSRMEDMEAVEKMLERAEAAGLRDGLAAGFAAAQRIMTWYIANTTLVNPKSEETLARWSNEELTGLRDRIRRSVEEGSD